MEQKLREWAAEDAAAAVEAFKKAHPIGQSPGWASAVDWHNVCSELYDRTARAFARQIRQMQAKGLLP